MQPLYIKNTLNYIIKNVAMHKSIGLAKMRNVANIATMYGENPCCIYWFYTAICPPKTLFFSFNLSRKRKP